MNVLEKDFLRAISNQLYDSSQKIDEVCSFFEEAYSVKIYKEVINRRICGCETEYGDLKVPDEIQYIFPQALYSKMEGAIIDCGGYIGDSIERFYNKMGVKSIHKIYTFEALPQNLEIIKKLKTSYGGRSMKYGYMFYQKPLKRNMKTRPVNLGDPIQSYAVKLLYRPDLWEKYSEIVNDFQSEDIGIYDDSADLYRAISIADAYYGDKSSVVQLFVAAGIPVMIQNADVR